CIDMDQSQTDWTHIADITATTPNCLYVAGVGLSGSNEAYGAIGTKTKKTKCCKIRKTLWKAIGLVIEVAILILLAYVTAKVTSLSEEVSKLSEKMDGQPGSIKPVKEGGSVRMSVKVGLNASALPSGEKENVTIGCLVGLNGCNGSLEENGSVAVDCKAGLVGSTACPDKNISMGMNGQAWIHGSTESAKENCSVGMGDQAGLPGSTESVRENCSVGMGDQAGLPGSTESAKENCSVGMGDQAGLPWSTESVRENCSVGMGDQAGLPGSTGSATENCSMGMGDQAGLPKEKTPGEMKGQAGLPGSARPCGTSGEKGPMGIGGGAGVTSSGQTEGNGPTGSVQPFKHSKTSDRHGSNKGYPKAGYVSFNGARYKSYTERMTRDEAVKACAADGGTLAMPKNSPTNTFLANLAKVVKSRWIGLTDANKDGHWVFEDGQTLESSGYANWRPGEPKPPNPRGGCAGFWSRGSSWSEQDCSFRRGFICQLSEVPGVFLGLENLEELEINSNAISVIPKGAFRGMPRLTTLHLEQNQLASVPVDALRMPPVLKRVNLQRNLITLVDNNVSRLQQNNQLRLWVSYNEWQCDTKLMWFICNLSRLRALNLISDADFLACASPAEIKGRLLSFLSTKICQTVTDGVRAEMHDNVYSEEENAPKAFASTHIPRRLESTGYERRSTLVITKTIAAKDTIPSNVHEDYTESSNDTPVSHHTTVVDQIVVILRGDAITHQEDNIIYLLAMTGAVVAPLLLVLTLVTVVFVYKRWRVAGLVNPDRPENDTESSKTEGTEMMRTNRTDEPYAVVYAHPPELQASERQNLGTDCTIACHACNT
ncbi:hypothetical protein Bbelb_241550, partial [Branchiostoma belcheri]